MKWILEYPQYETGITKTLETQVTKILIAKIKEKEMTSLKGLREHKAWKSINGSEEFLKKELAKQIYQTLLEKAQSKEITSIDEIKANEDWNFAYEKISEVMRYNIDNHLQHYAVEE